jgi:MoaA/NifB/PqqE/SkfB family radical SAM enzyme
MTLAEFQKAVDSYEGWPNRVGIMGGEPLLHPDFESMCNILRKAFPREQLGIFISNVPKYEKLRPLLEKTFAQIIINAHTNEQKKYVCTNH